MQIDETIFKSYDIRGIYPDQLDEDLAERIGKAFAEFIKSEVGSQRLKVAVGRDTRISSPQLFEAAVRGILAQGVDVDDIGLVSSDLMYFAVGKHEYDGGLMVSASHNPKEYNGFKMIGRGVRFISSNYGMPRIKELVLQDQWEACTPGVIDQTAVTAEYVDFILSQVDIRDLVKFKIVVDTGNGMAGVVCSQLFARIPCEYIPMFDELDGSFPNRNPNPLQVGALDQLSAKVRDTGADLGIAFDSDGDRLFMVDETGTIIRNDLILAVVAKIVLDKEPGSAIVYNLTCSHSVLEIIQEAGGTPVRSKTGHAFVKEQMKASNASFGGEVSGHYYYRESYYSECGYIALLMVLKVMSSEGKRLSELANNLDRYSYQPEINRRVEDRDAVISAIKQKYADGRQDEMDGLTVEYNSYWFNVRKSNTEPLVRLVVEANTKELRDAKIAELLAIIGGEAE